MDAATELRILQGVKAELLEFLAQLNADGIRAPAAYVARYGPIGMQAPARHGTNGFFANAPLVTPSSYLTPNYPTKANPKVSGGDFTLCSVNMGVELSWTYTSMPKGVTSDSVSTATVTGALNSSNTTVTVSDTTGYPASGTILIDSEQITYTAKGGGGTTFTGCTRGANGTTAAAHSNGATVTSLFAIATGPANSLPVAGLYDAAIASNGGAIVLDNFSGTQMYAGDPAVAGSAPVRPRVGCELDIYDLTRGRSVMPNGRISNEQFTGLTYGFKDIPRTIFPHGTEIEPRLYVTECRMMEILDTVTPTDWSKIQVAAWVTLTLKGFVTGRR